ncbi:hypothetical protein D7W79_28315 [Corallococcus exercitus]|uniref:Uncharacterized protein n=1 Tax=Corallococcus exercitus TaxID=2316736 RepID=A0A3A8HME0_9BACT|nr:hypothetical protein [Corallococcus exercitus]NOK35798.1 hypothetical protein [Corallococcus exercitus]RKG72469.1 hypothetical protein D7W79_28315 [Corallococcus exercitus]
MSSPLTEDSEVVRWLRAELQARGLARIELSASLKHPGTLHDDTLIITAPDGALSFGSLPEAPRAQVKGLMQRHHASAPGRGDIALSIVCEAAGPPRIRWMDEAQRQQDAKEQARAEAHFDSRRYGRALAQRVAELMDAGADLSLTVDPREGVSRALWRSGDGTYAHGLRYIQGDAHAKQTFASREEFIRWLAEQSDESLAKLEHPDDSRMWGLGTFNRAYFARKTGRRS